MKDSYGYFRRPFVYNISTGIRERCNEENYWKTESRENTRNKALFVKASRLFPSTARRFRTTARLNVTRANHDNKVYSYDDLKHRRVATKFFKNIFHPTTLTRVADRNRALPLAAVHSGTSRRGSNAIRLISISVNQTQISLY